MPDKICKTCIHFKPARLDYNEDDSCAYPLPLFINNPRYVDAWWGRCPCWTSEKVGGTE